VDAPGAPDDVIQSNMLRFSTLCPDIDMFDESLFRLGRSEAAAMDPQQRALLELTYAAVQVSHCAILSLDQLRLHGLVSF
jgi:acyl transferase domain-containing protein